MRVLTFTTLFPNAAQPRHGIFVETRLRQLCARSPVEARVVAPVPWFPFDSPRFGRYAAFAAAPRCEVRHGIEVAHPRFPVIPKLGMAVAPYFLARASLGPIRALIRSGFDFDLIDAHYFYPDGVAAALVAGWLNKPLTISARGSDIAHIAARAWPRRLIRWAAGRADAVITVCDALNHAVRELGVSHDEVHTLRNGVDLELFRPPGDRQALRDALGIRRRTLLSVGNLVELKGHRLVIDSLKQLADVDLIIIGDGPERQSLRRQASAPEVAGRVRFEGVVGQDVLRDFYGAADALVLASSREGWANVLLESMACATPVVATPVGGTPEVVSSPAAGVLTSGRSADAVAAAVNELFAHAPEPAATRSHAERFSWSATCEGLWQLYRRVLQRRSDAASCLPSVGH